MANTMSYWFDLMRSSLSEGGSGDCKIKKFTVSEEEARFDMMRASFRDRRFVRAGTYTKLSVNGTMMMADTHDEIRDHIEPVRLSRGTCLITGLGLGCVVQGMLEKHKRDDGEPVGKVIVIEKSEGVVDLVGSYFKDKYGDRFEIRNEDALTYKPPMGERYDVVWHDIWSNLCTDNLKQMERLHRKYGRRCDWQGSWGKEYLIRVRRREGSRYF